MVKRQIRRGNTFGFETVPSTLLAEDPGTYPPEVRRELATILYEMDTYRHERVAGGISRGQLKALAEEGLSNAEAVATLRQSGASAGGAVAGAPVYHDIITAAGGAYKHIPRVEMTRMLREALLEGRGSGLSDAAAQVARQRLEYRAAGENPVTVKLDALGQPRQNPQCICRMSRMG